MQCRQNRSIDDLVGEHEEVSRPNFPDLFKRAASKKNISNLQFAPTLNLSLPGHWFVTIYPSDDIRVNYGDPVTGQTGRLFLPFDFMIGRKLTPNLVLSLEVSVPIIKDYPVYNFKTEVRLNLLF